MVRIVGMNAVAFFGRGVKIQSLPDLVPDSIYAHRIGLHNPNATVPIQGRYSKAGTSIPLTSEEEVRKAMTEISGGKSPMMWIKFHGLSGMPHVAYCKIRESPVVAEMMRGLDKDGKMQMTGYAVLYGTKNEAQIQASARNLGKMLEETGLFGPLTPRDRIPEDDLRGDPRAYDYFATDQRVWSPGFTP